MIKAKDHRGNNDKNNKVTGNKNSNKDVNKDKDDQTI